MELLKDVTPSLIEVRRCIFLSFDFKEGREIEFTTSLSKELKYFWP